jgi:non-heme chloroperoxidase
MSQGLSAVLTDYSPAARRMTATQKLSARRSGEGIVAFSQTDFTEDLKKITVPVLVLHGDDDQIVPYADAGPLTAKLLRNSTLRIYKGFPHGMPTTEADTINADLLAFFKGVFKAAA